MNKSEMKSVFETIEKKLQGEKTYSFMEHTNIPAWRVFEEMKKHNNRQYVFNGVTYTFEYVPSHTTMGNRSTTAEFVVTRSTAKEVFDADQMLSIKEVEIRDWMGGDKRIGELDYNSKQKYLINELMMIVNHIYDNTSYSIMIDRHNTGDVTVWIDDKRFKQR